MARLPRLILQHIGGAGIATLVAGGLMLWHDVGGLAGLILRSETPLVAAALFFFALGGGFQALAVVAIVSAEAHEED